mmetsp:Transcript_35579/g.84943  ORF Transcript_35579/g.84943 Transcript_35579/m.84943 type:complete len:222 (+) Transcript_35579:2357-3022(+)
MPFWRETVVVNGRDRNQGAILFLGHASFPVVHINVMSLKLFELLSAYSKAEMQMHKRWTFGGGLSIIHEAIRQQPRIDDSALHQIPNRQVRDDSFLSLDHVIRVLRQSNTYSSAIFYAYLFDARLQKHLSPVLFNSSNQGVHDGRSASNWTVHDRRSVVELSHHHSHFCSNSSIGGHSTQTKAEDIEPITNERISHVRVLDDCLERLREFEIFKRVQASEV